jgi:hypothetical protein
MKQGDISQILHYFRVGRQERVSKLYFVTIIALQWMAVVHSTETFVATYQTITFYLNGTESTPKKCMHL